MIRRPLIELAIRLKQLGGEPYDVIGGDKLGQLTSRPPDRVYWTALRTWGLLVPGVDTRSEALRRLSAATRGHTWQTLTCKGQRGHRGIAMSFLFVGVVGRSVVRVSARESRYDEEAPINRVDAGGRSRYRRRI
jgi:hypothetical protein